MPGTMNEAGIAAFDFVVDSVNSATLERSIGAKPDEIAFLTELLNNPILADLVQAQDALEDSAHLQPVSCDNIELVRDISDELAGQSNRNENVKELRLILRSPHFKALIEVHDDVASKNYEVLPTEAYDLIIPPLSPAQQAMIAPSLTMMTNGGSQMLTQDAVRMVGIRKSPDESLGITVKKRENGLTIARILPGSMIEKQGLLKVGDVIKELNGVEVTEPDQLQDMLKRATGTITFKIIPTTQDQNTSVKVYLKAHFSYDPKRDNLIPCREAGMPFKNGDILQVVNRDDPNWWQACKVESTSVDPRQIELDNDVPKPTTGLIPSQLLEEKRKAFVRPEYDYTHKSLLCGLTTKKKRKMLYAVNSCQELDRTDLLIYEEVARMPPFQRKTLVLLGAKGVGRRTLKQRLIKADPQRFGSVVPYTSRDKQVGEEDGENYFFVGLEKMMKDIANNKFLEYGQLGENMYGTTYDSIREVIRSSRMCILDISPQAAKAIKTSEFMPYVVFIAAPPVEIQRNMYEFARLKGRSDKLKTEQDFRNTLEESAIIERQYKQYFDEIILNDNMDNAYKKLCSLIEGLSNKQQWVPVSWVY